MGLCSPGPGFPPSPGRVAEARGGEVVHHRGVDELPGTLHHCQHRIQVPGAASGAESWWRGLCGEAPWRHSKVPPGPWVSWTCDPPHTTQGACVVGERRARGTAWERGVSAGPWAGLSLAGSQPPGLWAGLSPGCSSPWEAPRPLQRGPPSPGVPSHSDIVSAADQSLRVRGSVLGQRELWASPPPQSKGVSGAPAPRPLSLPTTQQSVWRPQGPQIPLPLWPTVSHRWH